MRLVWWVKWQWTGPLNSACVSQGTQPVDRGPFTTAWALRASLSLTSTTTAPLAPPPSSLPASWCREVSVLVLKARAWFPSVLILVAPESKWCHLLPSFLFQNEPLRSGQLCSRPGVWEDAERLPDISGTELSAAGTVLEYGVILLPTVAIRVLKWESTIP